MSVVRAGMDHCLDFMRGWIENSFCTIFQIDKEVATFPQEWLTEEQIQKEKAKTERMKNLVTLQLT